MAEESHVRARLARLLSRSLVKAVQELNRANAELRLRNEELERRMTRVETVVRTSETNGEAHAAMTR